MYKLVAFTFAIFCFVTAEESSAKNNVQSQQQQQQPLFFFSRLIAAPLRSRIQLPAENTENVNNDREEVTPATRNVPSATPTVGVPTVVADRNVPVVNNPVVPAVVNPATVLNTPVVTARSSQVFARNYNALSAPLVASSAAYSSYVTYPYTPYYQAIVY